MLAVIDLQTGPKTNTVYATFSLDGTPGPYSEGRGRGFVEMAQGVFHWIPDGVTHLVVADAPGGTSNAFTEILRQHIPGAKRHLRILDPVRCPAPPMTSDLAYCALVAKRVLPSIRPQ